MSTLKFNMCPNLEHVVFDGVVQLQNPNGIPCVMPYVNSCIAAGLLSLVSITFHVHLPSNVRLPSTVHINWDDWQMVDATVSEDFFPALAKFSVILRIWEGKTFEQEKLKLEGQLPNLKSRNILRICIG